MVAALTKSDLYSSLWRSCDELRGGMGASQYKDYILTLLFVKYVTDKAKADRTSLIDIPSGRSFDDMVSLKGNKEIPGVIAKWEPKLEVSVPWWTIRRMKTKRDSCNRETGHIWFNVELAKKRPDCLEYIVIHEMIHHLERSHDVRFVKLMDKLFPNWRSFRDQLNDAPLAQANRA